MGIRGALEQGIRTVYCIALVGGQTAGKTEAIKAVRGFGYHDRIHTLGELARSEWEVTGYRPDMSDPEEMSIYQRWIYQVQCQHEMFASIEAVRRGRSVLLADRSRLCGVPYLGISETGKAVAAFERLCGTTKAECYAAYDAIFFLEMPPEDAYEAIRQRRQTEYPIAQSRSVMLFDMWKDHPGFRVVAWMEDVRFRHELLFRQLFDCTASR